MEENKPNEPVYALIGELRPEADDKPLDLDLHEFARQINVGKYNEGLAIRKALGERLSNATSVNLVNLPAPGEPGYIGISQELLLGIFGGHFRRGRTVRGPEWLRPVIDIVRTTVSLAALSPVGSGAVGLDGLLDALTSVAGNPFDDIPLYQPYDHYRPEIKMLSMIEATLNLAKVKSVYYLARRLVTMLEENQNVYLGMVSDGVGAMKGRWARIRYYRGMNDRHCPTITYGKRTVAVLMAYCKIAGSGPSCDRFVEPDPSVPVFFVGYDATDTSKSDIRVYPIIGDTTPLPCNLKYYQAERGRLSDGYALLKDVGSVPGGVVHMKKEGRLMPVLDKNGLPSDYTIPD